MSFGELGEEHEESVEPTRRQATRLLLSLVIAGLVAGLLFAGLAWVVGVLAQTESGFCRLTPVPCTSLSLATIESLAMVDLPDDTRVVSGYVQERGGASTFRAEVVLPDGAALPLGETYEQLEGDWSDVVPAADDRELDSLQYWFRPLDSSTSVAGAADGLDDEGRTVILFDTRLEP